MGGCDIKHWWVPFEISTLRAPLCPCAPLCTTRCTPPLATPLCRPLAMAQCPCGHGSVPVVMAQWPWSWLSAPHLGLIWCVEGPPRMMAGMQLGEHMHAACDLPGIEQHRS